MKSTPLVIRVPDELKEQLEVKASAEHITVSDLVRRYIDKGLNLEGYKSEIDFLSEIMQTVLSGVLDPHLKDWQAEENILHH